VLRSAFFPCDFAGIRCTRLCVVVWLPNDEHVLIFGDAFPFVHELHDAFPLVRKILFERAVGGTPLEAFPA
jgi:hypothetical protein